MSHRARRVLLLAAAGALGVAVAHYGVAAQAQAMGQYVSPTGGFSIMFPMHWEQRPLGGGGIIALSPQETPTDTFRENVNVVYEMLPGPMTAQQYAAANYQNMATTLQSFSVLEQGQGPVGGRDAFWGIYTHTLGQPLMVLAYFFVSGNRGYVITCTGNPVELPRWRPLFAQIASTFRL